MRILLYVFGWILFLGGLGGSGAEAIFAGIACLLLGALLSARRNRARKGTTTTITTIVNQSVD